MGSPWVAMSEGLKTCRVCKKDVAEHASSCPHCGANRPADLDYSGITGVLQNLGKGDQPVAETVSRSAEETQNPKTDKLELSAQEILGEEKRNDKLEPCLCCGELISIDTIKCPQCGEKAPTEGGNLTKAVYGIAFVAALLSLEAFGVWTKIGASDIFNEIRLWVIDVVNNLAGRK